MRSAVHHCGVHEEGEWPLFDDQMATKLVGSHVLVGITYEGRDGSVEQREQIHGEVISADKSAGTCIRRAGCADVYWLAPDLRGWQPAPRGEYQLKSTGEVVVDPDYLASWTIIPPCND